MKNSKVCATKNPQGKVASKSFIQLIRAPRLQPTVFQLLQSVDLHMVKADVLASRNDYGGPTPMRMSHHCSYFLHLLAELQQGLFSVNTCLYYIENDPRGCPACHQADETKKSEFQWVRQMLLFKSDIGSSRQLDISQRLDEIRVTTYSNVEMTYVDS